MAKQILSDEDIKYILRLIDKKIYTQQELADRFGVSQGTISRYNRIKRLQFRAEHDAKLIARLNKEIVKLKSELNLDLTEELSVPESFNRSKIVLDTEDGEVVLNGYTSYFHYDCCRFVERHPEYTTYAMAHYKDDPSRPEFLRGRVRVGLFKYFLSPKNFGILTYKKQIKILSYEEEE